MDLPLHGIDNCGAISASGTRTNARSARRGWGISRPGSLRIRLSKSRMSRSRVRGPLAMPAERSRPNSFSIASSRSSSARGARSVSKRYGGVDKTRLLGKADGLGGIKRRTTDEAAQGLKR